MAVSKAVLVAAGSGAFAVILGSLYMNRFESDVSGGTRIAILTTSRDVAPGTDLAANMIAVRNVPAAYVDDRAVLARDRDKVVGVEVVTGMKAQETLQWSDLAVRSDARNVSQLVAPGKRAVSIRARSTDNAGNALMQPGDYVDVFAIVDAQGMKTSVLLLQRVLVIAIGLDTEQSQNAKVDAKNRRDDRLLTLSLDVDETQLLSLATEQGHIAVALRNPTDQRVFEHMPDLGASALVEARDKVQLRKASAYKAPPPAPVAAEVTAPVKLTEAR